MKKATQKISRRDFCRYTVTTSSILTVSTLSLQACGNEERPDTIPGTPEHTQPPLTSTPTSPPKQMHINPDMRVSADTFTMHAETCISANPRNPHNLLGICMTGNYLNDDTQKKPGASIRESGFLATYASFDGGANWQSNGNLALPNQDEVIATDPTVTFNGDGQAFACASILRIRSPLDRGIYIWHSEDGGRSFGPPVAAVDFHKQRQDHPWMAADRSGVSLYFVWAGGNSLSQLGFTRSTDGGQSFEPVRMIAEEPAGMVIAGAMVTTGSNGLICAIYGVGSHEAFAAEVRQEITIPTKVIYSTDYGQTFSQPIELGLGTVELTLPGGGATTATLPTITASHHKDAIYAAFVNHQPDVNHADILLSASYDRGKTWSPATSISQPAEGVFYFQPQLSVDEAGRVAISAFSLEQDQVSVVLFIAEPDTLDFGPPIRVSSQPFDPEQNTPSGASKHGAWWIGDYQGLTSTPDAFHLFWNDTRPGQLELYTAKVSWQ